MKISPPNQLTHLPNAPADAPSGSAAPASPRLAMRVVLLVVCTALGALAGIAGYLISGQIAWYLAIPACVAIGWLVVADPTACLPVQADRSDDDQAQIR